MRRVGRTGAAASARLFVLVAAALLIGPTAQPAADRAPALAPAWSSPHRSPSPPETTEPSGDPVPARPLIVPASLTGGGLDLRAGPHAVPLLLLMPTLGVGAEMLGVGLTADDVMDAPMGRAEDPVWQQAFWYRGSAVPGASSTALIAGHAKDPLGRPAVFAHIDRLQRGDPIVVHDLRSGVDVQFSVTETRSYSLSQASEPAVLVDIYGAGPVTGTGPVPSADGVARLTLITCSGTFSRDAGTHDHRHVVLAVRTA